jgi:hypothetical protein
MQGRPDAAEEQVEAGLAVVEALGARRFRAFLLESAARIRLTRGPRGRAGRHRGGAGNCAGP